MRRILIAGLLVGGLAATVSFAPTAMAAKPTGPTITGITGYSDGPETIFGQTFCDFHVVTTYSGKAKKGYSLSWSLTDNGTTTNADGETTSLGRSPFSVAGGFSPAPENSDNYQFIVQILDPQGTVISQVNTSMFTLSSSPDCPPAGQLVMYPS